MITIIAFIILFWNSNKTDVYILLTCAAINSSSSISTNTIEILIKCKRLLIIYIVSKEQKKIIIENMVLHSL